MKKDLIIISGAPGNGKNTLAKLLKEKLNSVEIEFSALRNFHLDNEWKNKNQEEEQIAYTNLLFIIRNYLSHGYKNIIVHDLQDFRVPQIATEFKNSVIIALTAESSALAKRIIDRNEGWKNTNKAAEWNDKLKNSPLLPNEFRIDNTKKNPTETLGETLKFLAKRQN